MRIDLEEFNKVIELKQENAFVVEVLDHKTLDSHGPENVVLTKTLYSLLEVFQTELRSKVSKHSQNENPYFFLSWKDKKMESSQISKSLKSMCTSVLKRFSKGSGDRDFEKAQRL